jgi:hypothetical protein
MQEDLPRWDDSLEHLIKEIKLNFGENQERIKPCEDFNTKWWQTMIDFEERNRSLRDFFVRQTTRSA